MSLDPTDPILTNPIAPCFVYCGYETSIEQPSAPLPDVLAYTGPFDIAATALGALVLLYAGLALLRGRRA